MEFKRKKKKLWPNYWNKSMRNKSYSSNFSCGLISSYFLRIFTIIYTTIFFFLLQKCWLRVKREKKNSLCYFNFNIALWSNCSLNQHPIQCSLPNSKWPTAYFQLNALKENSFSSFKKSVLHLIFEFFLILLL